MTMFDDNKIPREEGNVWRKKQRYCGHVMVISVQYLGLKTRILMYFWIP